MMHLCQPMLDILLRRSIDDVDEFLAPPSWARMPSSSTIEGVDDAVRRLVRAAQRKERAVIYGDYDCDGVLATAILAATLRRVGLTCATYVPHRDEGYGFSSEALHRFSRHGFQLILTVDNGINAQMPVRVAQRLGIDTLVVDHHLIDTRASTLAVWSPKFSAAGLALLLSRALLEHSAVPDGQAVALLDSLGRLAAIAAIADCVPLTGSNRLLTRLGMEALRDTRHSGLRKLLDLAGVAKGKAPTSEQIAFRIAPRINAAGRMDHPRLVLEMLAASSDAAVEGALVLDRLNQERRRVERTVFAQLIEQVGDCGDPALVVYGERWPRGITGILAARAAEHYGVPAIVLVRDQRTGLAVGSGRSVRGLNLIRALRQSSQHLLRFGGHEQAAGLTMAVEAIPEFRESFLAAVAKEPLRPDEPKLEDAELNLYGLPKDFFLQLQQLEPFGIGNPAPVFRIPLVVAGPARSGRFHLQQGQNRLQVRSGKVIVPAGQQGTAWVEMTGSESTLVRFLAA